ncbi:glycosyltransferase [Xylanibacillus composti]|uniref:N-acetylglucosaminyldiphosphoundecaprenol N-acetyl-beta-D-mannosaminyltransferase n=1 Tax=Xylanibacillus composti TaxID=1572762 RepID=A0A8J4H1G0_9BACL|nr:WecB/TagA/CpsF family glycosyltransferase [Xylanibacillus composti]MDT9725866.1 glycosyltransferase [Xylanibacillus composti]GIQ69178.1 hypothetical protein XYCOK13_20020 [Xylanibacillus composti]
MNPIHSPKRYPFHSTYLHALSVQEIVEWAHSSIQHRTAAQLIVAGTELLVRLQRSAELRDIVNASPMICAGDHAVVLASRLHGIPVPERVTQIELVDKLLALANQSRYRIFLVGEEPELLQSAELYIRLFYPYLQVSGAISVWLHSHEETNALHAIARSGSDILFVALPSPERELWLHNCMHELNVPLCVGADAALDDYAARIRHSPAWIKGTVFERLFFFARRGRHFARSIRSCPAFLAGIVRDRRRRKRSRSAPRD